MQPTNQISLHKIESTSTANEIPTGAIPTGNILGRSVSPAPNYPESSGRSERRVSQQILGNFSPSEEKEKNVARKIDPGLRYQQKELTEHGAEDRSYFLQRQGELARINAELEGLRKLILRQNILSPVDGKVYAMDDHLREGVYIKKDDVLAQVAASDRIEVLAFVPERDLSYWHVDQEVEFRTENRLRTASGKVKEIGPSRLHDLAYPQLAAQNKGTLPTVQDPNSKALLLVESFYPVLIELNPDEPMRINETGQILLKGPWTSYVGRFLEWFGSILWRESGI